MDNDGQILEQLGKSLGDMANGLDPTKVTMHKMVDSIKPGEKAMLLVYRGEESDLFNYTFVGPVNFKDMLYFQWMLANRLIGS